MPGMVAKPAHIIRAVPREDLRLKPVDLAGKSSELSGDRVERRTGMSRELLLRLVQHLHQ
jgi:hypothetical protein